MNTTANLEELIDNAGEFYIDDTPAKARSELVALQNRIKELESIPNCIPAIWLEPLLSGINAIIKISREIEALLLAAEKAKGEL